MIIQPTNHNQISQKLFVLNRKPLLWYGMHNTATPKQIPQISLCKTKHISQIFTVRYVRDVVYRQSGPLWPLSVSSSPQYSSPQESI
jgi:hypothetical protein